MCCSNFNETVITSRYCNEEHEKYIGTDLNDFGMELHSSYQIVFCNLPKSMIIDFQLNKLLENCLKTQLESQFR